MRDALSEASVFLNNNAILSHRSKGMIFIEPFQPQSLRPASYVLHLSGWTRKWKSSNQPVVVSDPVDEDRDMEGRRFADVIQIKPGEFVLARSIERVGISSSLGGVLSPLSHIARFGLSVTGGADWINPGFGARAPTPITFELLNGGSTPLSLNRGIGLCHLRITTISEHELSTGEPVETARSPYEGGDGLGPPRLEMEPSMAWVETSSAQ